MEETAQHPVVIAPAKKRTNGITIISGGQGIGKSYNLKQIIRSYPKDNHRTGKKGRKCIIYDVNDEYTEYAPIYWKDIGIQRNKTIRRVLPYKKGKDGKAIPFDNDELKAGFMKLLDKCSHCMLVLEDFNSYALNTRGQKVLSTLTRARHKKIDIVIVLQEIGKVTKDLWSNISFYIYHRQMSDIDKEQKKITNFPMVKIADNIVNEQYDLATDMFHEGQITEDDYNKYKSFFVCINFKTNKITGCDSASFDRAVYRFIRITEKEKPIREWCVENNMNFNNQEHKIAAYTFLLKRYRTWYGGNGK